MITSIPQPECKLLILDDTQALAREAAQRFTKAAARAVESESRFRVALAGGTTPLETYRALVAEPYVFSVHWGSVEFFWGDERLVPLDDPASNYRGARKALLDRLPATPAGIHPVPTDAGSVQAAAAAYQKTMLQVFELGPQEVPRFDLIMLGLGADGHTASLFPGALPAADRATFVAGVEAERVIPSRVTLTPAALNAAREVIFLVSGADKADILERVLRAEGPDLAIPATLVRPVRGKVTWLADREAASGVVESAEAADGNGGLQREDSEEGGA